MSLVPVLHKMLTYAVSRCSRATTSEKWTKNRDACAKLLFCLSKPIAFLLFLLSSSSSLRGKRDFKIQRRGRQGERQKTIGLITKTTTSHVHHTFLYISSPFLHDYDVKVPNFAFYGGRKQATTKFYFSL